MSPPQSTPPSTDPPGGPPDSSSADGSSPNEQPPRSPLIAVVGSIGYVVGVFAFVIAASIALMFAVAGVLLLSGEQALFEELIAGDGMIALVVAEAVLLGVGTVLAAVLSFSTGWVPKRVVGFAVPSPRELLVGIGAVIALLAIAMSLGLVSDLLGVPASDHALFDEDAPASYYLGLAALSILVIGPVEELLFRGLIQNYMRPAFGGIGAIVGTSVLFAAVHLPAYLTGALSTALVSLGVIFALSIVLGAVYERYRNIVLVMAIHGFYNAILFSAQIGL
ncbi:CPBP family intramembrane glutamic endopeptidase [Natrarchaeobaculum sulfurireducens]|uniref:CPBP family intramembrane glutamic endopeptidase n=1 Tax=Natrarchaeobaculum sulfurireducens TaxID=2044521 RepID=UPI000E3CF45C|nr:type II CAAX endopeptidase family protein [Natrarchaeobaculum sulfurireducens]